MKERRAVGMMPAATAVSTLQKNPKVSALQRPMLGKTE
jgi:hypothetical protein